jgi:hypothetical protein
MKEFLKQEQEWLRAAKEHLGEVRGQYVHSIAESPFMDQELLAKALQQDHASLDALCELARAASSLFQRAFVQRCSEVVGVDANLLLVGDQTAQQAIAANDDSAYFGAWLADEGQGILADLGTVVVSSPAELATVIRTFEYNSTPFKPGSRSDVYSLQGVLYSVSDALETLKHQAVAAMVLHDDQQEIVWVYDDALVQVTLDNLEDIIVKPRTSGAPRSWTWREVDWHATYDERPCSAFSKVA